MSTAVQLAPAPVFKAFDNNGAPLFNGLLYSYVAGSSTPQATYVDSTGTTPNTNPVVLNARGEANVWLAQGLTYKLTLTDALGNQIWSVDQIPGGIALTQASLGALLFPQTAAESLVGVVPTNYAYQFGDLRRYGGDPTGGNDSSTALQSAASVGYIFIPPASTFKILTGVSRTGQITVLGSGATSVIQCDGTWLTVTSGTGSVVDNFTCVNITAPYVLSRNPNSWGTTITTLSQSNTVLGYQPTVNDPEYAALSVTYPSITTQNIGPNITFQGNATNIEVSRIYGRFVCITIYDAQYSSIHDCDFRAGKNLGGAVFWNINNQIGEFNKIYNNRITYASYSGCTMARNYDFEMNDNTSLLNGESGVKTYQDTLAGVDARCYKGLIADNVCNYNYFDGIDASSSINTSTVVARWVKVTGNSVFQNGGDGINADGQFMHLEGNQISFNYRFGIWASTTVGLSYSQVIGNFCYDNNQARTTTNHDISIVATSPSDLAWNAGTTYIPGNRVSLSGNNYLCMVNNTNQSPPNSAYWNPIQPGANHIAGNYIYANIGQNNYGIYAPGTNYVGENFGVNGSPLFFGNPGATTSVVQNVADSVSGLNTDQAFTLVITNTAGTLQHQFYSDPGGQVASNLLTRIIGSTSALTNTPTGTDASTAFAAGGKIGSGSPQVFWCNTAYEQSINAALLASISSNSTGTAIAVAAQFSSININGVTLNRLAFVFTNATTGAAFSLNTTNIAAGKSIAVQFIGKLA